MQVIARAAAVIAALVLISTSTQTQAEIILGKGIAASPYAGRLTPEIKATTVRDAKLNALERYIAESNPAKQRLFDTARDRLTASLDTYILSAVVLNETDIAPAVNVKKFISISRAQSLSARSAQSDFPSRQEPPLAIRKLSSVTCLV